MRSAVPMAAGCSPVSSRISRKRHDADVIPNEPTITPELVAEHGLKPDEYERILQLIGREPTITELGIFSAMWNEHCSYKSSKIHLRTLPTTGAHVIQGPGENAGVISIGDGLAVVFKMESHNHPSYIEPYQGAATGVGGILRDVFTMGARPIACLNALSFGDPKHPKTRHLVSGVVAGVGGYGNSFGVPTVGGSVRCHERYNGNNLVNVPTRETGMTPYEMMLSESQERMLMVLKAEKEKEAEDIFRKWGLDFAIVGQTTPDKRFVVRHGGQQMADLPIKELGDEAPVYDRPHTAPPRPAVIDPASIEAPIAHADALEKLLASPDLCSKRWVWEQYDHLILGNTVQRPGGDAAVVRVKEGPKGLALTTVVTPRYCEADPFEGGKQAVAETWRNLSAVGAKPMAVTDNLNFGNPERPEIMGQFVGCVQGIATACKALEFPVVSGNVSLYNETNGRAILPTPTIGGVGLIDDFTRSATIAFKAADEMIVLLGETKGWLGQSLYLREICGREEGAPPQVDLMAERRAGDFVRGLIGEQAVTAVHDISDGGLLVAVAEMALASGIGARLYGAPAFLTEHGFWFGEDQARYVGTIKADKADELATRAKAAGLPIRRIGVTHGNALTLPGERPILLDALREKHEGWLPAYMAGAAN